MILSLLGIGFLLFGSANKCISNSVVESNDSNDLDTGLRLTQSNNAFGTSTLSGGYNFQDYFYLDIDNPIHVNCYFNNYDDTFFNTVMYFNDNVYYLYELSIIQYQSQVSLTFSCVDYNDTTTLNDFVTSLSNNDNLYDLDVDFADLYFYITNPYILDSSSYEQFSKIFTNNDNQFVVSYNGYFSFLSGNITPFSERFTILGNIIFNNVIYYGFRSGQYSIDAISIDYVNSVNSVVVGVSYKEAPNIWFNNVKMTKSNYTYLHSIGVFGYVRPTTYDDSTFNDLLFSIMDSPIYMLSRLLNFELFGMNVFIAVSGLLTLALVVVVIRKIW